MSGSPDLDRPENEAREWFLLFQSQQASDDDQRQFENWLVVDKRHQLAYRQVETLWQDLAGLQETGELDALIRANRGFFAGISDVIRVSVERFPRAIFQPRMLAAAFSIVFAIGLFAVLNFRVAGETKWERYSTATGQLQELQLADGSVVTLGADSSVKVLYQRDRRLVELLRGRAFFDVHRDAERPFTVIAGDARVRVLGTRFDVNRIPGKVHVAVLEGEVSVALRKSVAVESVSPQASISEWRLTAGQQVETRRDSVSDVQTVDISELGAWREGRLVYRGASLLEVVSDANRYYEGSIALASNALGELKVSASFRSDQIELLLDMLTETLPVRVYRESNDKVVIAPDRDGGADRQPNTGFKST
jgi:transmembrane sensor